MRDPKPAHPPGVLTPRGFGTAGDADDLKEVGMTAPSRELSPTPEEDPPPWSWLWSAESLRKVCQWPELCLEWGGPAVCGPCGNQLAHDGEEPITRKALVSPARDGARTQENTDV